jgi:TPR repeat protein
VWTVRPEIPDSTSISESGSIKSLETLWDRIDMPYDPKVQDRSAEIRMEGARELGKSITEIGDTMAKLAERQRKEAIEKASYESKVAGLEQFVRANPETLGLDTSKKLSDFLAPVPKESPKHRYERLNLIIQFTLIAKNAEAARREALQYGVNVPALGQQELVKADPRLLLQLRKAADQGDVKSQKELGLLLYELNRDALDRVDALRWIRRVAEQGDPEAQKILGEMYYKAFGTQKSDTRALSWFRKSAEAGHARGQYHLGEMYFNGHGTSRDLKEAFAWWKLAHAAGDLDAGRSLRKVERLLLPSTLAEAEKLAATYAADIQGNSGKKP